MTIWKCLDVRTKTCTELILREVFVHNTTVKTKSSVVPHLQETNMVWVDLASSLLLSQSGRIPHNLTKSHVSGTIYAKIAAPDGLRGEKGGGMSHSTLSLYPQGELSLYCFPPIVADWYPWYRGPKEILHPLSSVISVMGKQKQT